MSLASVLVHVGVPIREEDPSAEEEWVEGEPAETAPVEGTAFDCFLIVPSGGEEENVPRGRRKIRRPVILYEPFDVTGADLALHAEDRVEITAPELTGSEPVLWQIEGEPTPMAKPGYLVGYEASLKRVED